MDGREEDYRRFVVVVERDVKEAWFVEIERLSASLRRAQIANSSVWRILMREHVHRV